MSDLLTTPPALEKASRVDRFFLGHFSEISRSRLKALIEKGCLLCNDSPVTSPSQKVRQGDVFTLTIPDADPAIPEAEDIPLTILYEDDALIVIDKPAGMVVHPAAGNQSATLVNALLFHCRDSLSGIGGVKRPGIVHRLDKDTSGVMVAAKTDAAHTGLSEQFAVHSIHRLYKAAVWGHPVPPKGRIEGAIGRHPVNRKKMTIRDSGGKHAVTHYDVQNRFPLGALVNCTLETGRTHQIRVHMTSIGHSLIGDPVYGRAPKNLSKQLDALGLETLKGFQRQALHAAELGFIHPVTGESMSFESPLPADMTGLISALSR